MNTKNALPKRKHPRLRFYDYSSTGAYFVTICTHKRKCIFSHIVGRGLAPADVEYTDYGKIAEQELLSLTERYDFLKIDKYIIMPNHIHVIFIFNNEPAGASPRPTLMDVVCTYKSMTTRRCKKLSTIDKVFQTSFYEHVIRNKDDYEKIVKYIHANPMQWRYDELYSEP